MLLLLVHGGNIEAGWLCPLPLPLPLLLLLLLLLLLDVVNSVTDQIHNICIFVDEGLGHLSSL